MKPAPAPNHANDPKKELEKARRIAEILEQNVYQASWYAALYERVVFNPDIGKSFGRSYAAWGVVKCQEALHDALVSAVIRIIRGDGDNTASLSTLIKIVKKPEIIKLLEDESLQAAERVDTKFMFPQDLHEETIKSLRADHKERRKKGAVENLHKHIRALDEMARKIQSDHQHANVNSYRNTTVSHQAIEIDPKKHKQAKYGDAPDLLKKLYPVVDLCVALVTGVSTDFEYHAEEAQRCAGDFWERAAHIKTKKR